MILFRFRNFPTFLLITVILTFSGCIDPIEESEKEENPEEDIFDYYFNTPTWDATYINESIMDQFTAGLIAYNTPKFNVTSDNPADSTEPPIYWRLGSLSTYEYSDKAPYTSSWALGNLSNRILPPMLHNLPSSTPVTRFQVELPINYSRSTLATVHPNFINFLPVPWSGQYGSYVSSDTIELYDENGQKISPLSQKVAESYPSILKDDLVGITTQLMLENSTFGLGTLKYLVDYQTPNIPKAATYSLTRTEADYLKCGLDVDTWTALKSIYLQLPESLPPGYSTYQDWAPTVTASAITWNETDRSVFGQTFANLMELGNMSHYTFDTEMWMGNQLYQSMPHPEEYEDYNEWFMQRGSGVSIHFASALTTINRLQNIPSRVVIGYLAGNNSYVYAGKRAFTSLFLHAWTEVLVPIDPLPEMIGDEYVEWISFDPLLPALSEEYGNEYPSDVVTPISGEKHLFIRPDYNLEENGLLQAYADHLVAQAEGDWVFERCIVNNSQFQNGTNLQHGDSIYISSRLIGVPSLRNWLPTQSVNVSFYLGGKYDNHTFWIEDGGIFIGSVLTDGYGIATMFFEIDITFTGVREIRFWTVVTFNKDSPNEFTHRAMSFWFVIHI